MKFTVCVLLYGDYPDLVERVLGGLSRPAWRDTFQCRVGFNNLSERSYVIASDHIRRAFPATMSYTGKTPFYKYPLMRRMLHESTVTTPYTLWFDDDSWVMSNAPDDWFEQIETCMETKKLHVAGAPYFVHLRGNQHMWIEDQPWYTGKEVSPRQSMDFITGGWLALRTELLYRFDWPVPDISHNGGDVMLGALCKQQGLRIGKFTNNLGINANDTGKCSTAKRRGAAITPVGVDYARKEKIIAVVEPNEWLRLFDGRGI